MQQQQIGRQSPACESSAIEGWNTDSKTSIPGRLWITKRLVVTSGNFQTGLSHWSDWSRHQEDALGAWGWLLLGRSMHAVRPLVEEPDQLLKPIGSCLHPSDANAHPHNGLRRWDLRSPALKCGQEVVLQGAEQLQSRCKYRSIEKVWLGSSDRRIS